MTTISKPVVEGSGWYKISDERMKEPGVVFSVLKTRLQLEGEVEVRETVGTGINNDSKAVETVCDSGPVHHELQESASGPVGTPRHEGVWCSTSK